MQSCGSYGWQANLKSETAVTRYYARLTSNLSARLVDHNAGRCTHGFGAPVERGRAIDFADEEGAVRFERYLKSGSGCAFAKRHFR